GIAAARAGRPHLGLRRKNSGRGVPAARRGWQDRRRRVRRFEWNRGRSGAPV
ncbi:MAG: hypothetical protein AVDCRST_MAG83-731, partial [uncultured Arthrobacter sp.]